MAEQELEQLIRQYEPVLLFSRDHEDDTGDPEYFFPMTARDFVSVCGLHRKGKGLECRPGEVQLEHLGGVKKSKNCYLVYSADVPGAEEMFLALDSLLAQGYEPEMVRLDDQVMPRVLVTHEVADSLTSGWSETEREPVDADEIESWLGQLPEFSTSRAAYDAVLSTVISPGVRVSPAELEQVYLTRFASVSQGMIDAARDKYRAYRGDWKDGKHLPVYHYHVCKDRGYLILQYWFLYAYNDWAAHRGMNNHEGDWEVVYVFLDEETRNPKWVAYSRHIRVNVFIFRYMPNTAQWSEDLVDRGKPFLEDVDSVARAAKVKGPARVGTHPVVFVGCGSHASYLERRAHLVGSDHAYGNLKEVSVGPGAIYRWDAPINLNQTWNMGFKGRWGAPFGSTAPIGPAHKDDKWDRPAKWAGIPKCK